MGLFKVTRGGSGGATTSLSNLASVAFNADLVPDTTNTRNLGSSSKVIADLNVLECNLYKTNGSVTGQIEADLVTPSAVAAFGIRATTDNAARPLGLVTQGNIGATASGPIYIESGNTVDGNSGDIQVRVGVPSGSGTRGKIKLQALALSLPQGSSDPAGVAGDIYYNTGTNKIRWYNGSAWADLA